jgi:hypothetical protein
MIRSHALLAQDKGGPSGGGFGGPLPQDVLAQGRAVYKPTSVKGEPTTRMVAGTLIEAYMDEIGEPARRCLVLVLAHKGPDQQETYRTSIAFSDTNKIRGLIADFGAGQLEAMKNRPAALHTVVAQDGSGGRIAGISAIQ